MTRLELAWGLILVCSQASAQTDACTGATRTAQTLSEAGKLLEARKRLAACSSLECPESLRIACLTALAELGQSIPSIVVRAQDASEVFDARVTLDGERGPTDGRPIEADPGSHVLRIEALGRPAFQQTLVLAKGEKERLVTVDLAQQHVTRATPGPPSRVTRPIPLHAYALAAIGVASLVAWSAFGLNSILDYNQLKASCSPTCDPERVAWPHAEALFADAFGILALGTLVLATVVVVTRPTVQVRVGALSASVTARF